MPGPERVIGGLTELAQQWHWLAVAWHVLLAALLVGFYAGWRPTTNAFLAVLIAPLISVSVLAWVSGNPFNGSAFALLAVSLGGRALWEPEHRVGPGPRHLRVPGVLLVAFGAAYPEFTDGSPWARVVTAPLGLLPCPTLAVVAGLVLMMRGPRWTLPAMLAVAACAYAILGVFWLGVESDLVLLGAALLLAGHALGLHPRVRLDRPRLHTHASGARR